MNRFIHHKIYWLLLTLVAFVYLLGMIIDVMDVDAAQYASISMEMLQNKSFLSVYARGDDYLDKPPLLFWLSSLSMGVFGLNNIAYKLPSVFALFLAVYSVYRIAKLYYSEKGALMAGMLVAVSQAFFIMSYDVRTDNLLIGFATFSIWHILEYIKRPNYSAAIYTGLGIGLALLAKGPLGLIFPLLSVVPQIFFQRGWKSLMNFKWLIAIPIIVVLLIPMCIGLYNQFGTHGLYFFFWEQSFGRITGENKWENNMGSFFLVHTFLYAILPWTILFIASFFNQGVSLIKNKFSQSTKQPEILGFFGYLLTTIALSQSKYQLPHYIYIAIPAAALMIVGYLEQLKRNSLIKWGKVQNIFNILFALFALVVCFYVWEFTVIDKFLILLLGITTAYIYYKVKSYSLVWGGAVIAIFVNTLLLGWFFPNLLSFQSSSQAGKVIDKMGIAEKTYFYKDFGMAMEFYSKKTIYATGKFYQVDSLLQFNQELYLYTTDKAFNHLESIYKVEEISTFKHFKSTTLNFKFLNPETRDSVLKTKKLIKVTK